MSSQAQLHFCQGTDRIVEDTEVLQPIYPEGKTHLEIATCVWRKQFRLPHGKRYIFAGLYKHPVSLPQIGFYPSNIFDNLWEHSH